VMRNQLAEHYVNRTVDVHSVLTGKHVTPIYRIRQLPSADHTGD
jgi:hypothetical protein